MSADTATITSDGFSAAERAAMKKRAAELRAEGKKGAKKADGLQAVLDSIAAMAPEDRAMAERVHVTVTANAPELSPKTWYGMPAYANADGKVVVFFQDSGKFNYRYSTLGFQDVANLDDGDVWPVSYALIEWTPMAEKRVAELVRPRSPDQRLAASLVGRAPERASVAGLEVVAQARTATYRRNAARTAAAVELKYSGGSMKPHSLNAEPLATDRR